MKQLFVPYTGKRPSALLINGHRLAILCDEAAMLQQDLGLLGADSLKRIKVNGNQIEVEKALGKIAQEIDGGIVIAPADVELTDVIKNLESELPWLH